MLYFWAQKHLLARSDLLLHIIQNKTKHPRCVYHGGCTVSCEIACGYNNLEGSSCHRRRPVMMQQLSAMHHHHRP